MSGIKIEMDEKLFSKFQKNIENEAMSMIHEIGALTQNAVRAVIVSDNLVNTSNYVRSVQLDFKKSGKGVAAVVGTNSLYALPLELGMTKQFYPSKDMIQALKLWAKRKLGLSEKEANKAGPAIAWSIARKGYLAFPKRFGKKGARSWERGFQIAIKRVPSIVERYVRRAAALTEPTSS